MALSKAEEERRRKKRRKIKTKETKKVRALTLLRKNLRLLGRFQKIRKLSSKRTVNLIARKRLDQRAIRINLILSRRTRRNLTINQSSKR